MEPASPVILLVEDELATSELLRLLLEREGFRTETAADGPNALTRVQAGGIDLVLLDVMLPGMDGFELSRRIRASGGQTYLPIIMVTGLVTSEDRHAGFAAGADDYVTKPFNIQDIVDRVRVWVRTREYLKGAQRYTPWERGREDDGALLSMALSASNDLTRLLMLLLSLLEDWETSGRSPQDLQRLRGEFRDAAAVLASRINLITRSAHASAGASTKRRQPAQHKARPARRRSSRES
jgi:DNA-binding response OmpR family regulator